MGTSAKSGTHTRPVTNSPPLSFLTSSFCSILYSNTLSLIFGVESALLVPSRYSLVDYLYSVIQSATSLSHPSLYAIRSIRQRSRRWPEQVRGNKVGREEKTLSWHILPLPFILAQPIPARALPCPQLEPELVPWRQRRIACALDLSRSVA